MNYYLDTSVWLNLFKKEKYFWKIAKKFIITKSIDSKIFVSTIVLKELSYKLGDEFSIVMQFFKTRNFIVLVKTKNNDYDFAREIEISNNFELSFYDCLHIAISRRLNLTIVTRDNELIKLGKKHVQVDKPENLIN